MCLFICWRCKCNYVILRFPKNEFLERNNGGMITNVLEKQKLKSLDIVYLVR
jgi:hypothetical protein